jgi:hypothetical protein
MSTPLELSEKDVRTRRKQLPAPAAGLPLMTRAQLVVFLNANGFPISSPTLAKLAAPSVNQGPPIAAWWGKRPLHAPGPSLEWAKSLLRDGPSEIAPGAA